MWKMAEVIKTCTCGKVLTTHQAQMNMLCTECQQKHLEQFKELQDFTPEQIKHFKEFGY